MIAEGRLQAGDVVISIRHQFEDGAVADRKYLVMIGERNGNVLFFITTTKEKQGRKPVAGCCQSSRPPSFHVLPPKKKSGKFKHKTRQGFPAPTWVKLEAQHLPDAEILQKLQNNRMYRDFSLTQDEFNALWACFRNSLEFAPIHAEFR